MDSKILFMIVDNQVLYLSNSNMDHKEWYVSLGFDASNFDNVIRGFVIDNKIIFYKGFFEYDDTVIKYAETFSPSMKEKLNNPSLEVYCGILPGKPGEKWEPILKISGNTNNNDRFSSDTSIEVKKREKVELGELDSIIDFKNDYNDNAVVKKALISTIVVLVINLISNIILLTSGSLILSGVLSLILFISQFILLGFSIYGYIIKWKYTHITSLAASLLIIFSLNIISIITGIIYALYVIDQSILETPLIKLKNSILKK